METNAERLNFLDGEKWGWPSEFVGAYALPTCQVVFSPLELLPITELQLSPIV
jgi:hypothetical protein